MLQTELIKDMHSSYLVIKADKETNRAYSNKMLMSNDISGILKLEQRYLDQITLFYYNINGRITIKEMYSNTSIKYEELKHLLLTIVHIIQGISEYLLHENDFILDPNYIYIEPNSLDIKLCYLVGYDKSVQEQFSVFIEYLMNRVDYKDDAAVLLIYSIYKESKESYCTYTKLIELLTQKFEDSVVRLKGEILEKADDSTINGHITRDIDMIGPKQYPKKEQVEKRGVNTYNNQVNSINKNKFIIKDKAKEIVITDNSKSKGLIHRSDRIQKGLNKDISKKEKYVPLLEEIEDEKEVSYYDIKTYILGGMSLIAGITIFILLLANKVLHNIFLTRIDPVKLISSIIIICSIEVYIYTKLFHEDRKITKMVSYINYESPHNQDHNSTYDCQEVNGDITMDQPKMKETKTLCLWEEDIPEDKTVVLLDLKSKYFLRPLQNDVYKYIAINEFPFIIGKSDTGVNHKLCDPSISRLHGKIEQLKEQITITDLGSTNGTFVNGLRLIPQVPQCINNKDEIKFSNISYNFLIE